MRVKEEEKKLKIMIDTVCWPIFNNSLSCEENIIQKVDFWEVRRTNCTKRVKNGVN